MANVIVGRKSGFIRRAGVMRRATEWLFLPHSQTVQGASATAVLIASLNAAALALRPFTVVRTRLDWLCFSDQSAATENFVGNIGVAVVSDQAIAVGVTAVPTPATDLGSDLWFLHQIWHGRFELVGTSINTDSQSKEIDSKAMRKVDEGQDMAFVVEAGIGESGLATVVAGRVLIKLH